MGVIDDWYTDGSISFKKGTDEDILRKVRKMLEKLKLEVKDVTAGGVPEFSVYNSNYIDVTSLAEDLVPYYDYIEDIWICPKGVIWGEDRVSIDDIQEMKEQLEEEAKDDIQE